MIKNERMGGYVPSWETPNNAKDQINTNLMHAGAPTNTFQNALSLQSDGSHNPDYKNEQFGFGDLVDMVNPLHHIPLVGSVYRGITGDEIKPIGKIIGGGVFGGGIGAASGLVNVVIESETGKDIPENAYAMARGDRPTFKSLNTPAETDLTKAIETANTHQKDELHPSLMAFTDTNADYKSFNLKQLQNSKDMAAALPPREPITTLNTQTRGHIEQKVPFKEL